MFGIDSFLIVGVVFLALVVWAIFTFNAFVRERNLIDEAWSGIDVQLKRRHDLIPNLVEAVRGYMQHERGLLDEVSNSRERALGAQSVAQAGQAEGELTRTLRSLFAVAEAYPDLKASQNFLDLQDELSQIEDQLQLARRYYNGTVRDFNIRVQSFPSGLVARGFGFQAREFFEIEEPAEREVPQVRV